MTARGFYALCAAGCAGGWAWTAWAMACPGQGLWKGCLFKMLFHLPCPSCGVTRSVTALFHGQAGEAFACNPLGGVVAGLLVLLPLWMGADGVRRETSLYRWFNRMDGWLKRPPVFASFAVLVLLNWMWVIGHVA